MLESIEMELIERDHEEQLLFVSIFVHYTEIDHEFSVENLHQMNSFVFLIKSVVGSEPNFA